MFKINHFKHISLALNKYCLQSKLFPNYQKWQGRKFSQTIQKKLDLARLRQQLEALRQARLVELKTSSSIILVKIA